MWQSRAAFVLLLFAGCVGAPPPPVVVDVPGDVHATLASPPKAPPDRGRAPAESSPIAWVKSEVDALARARKAGLPMLVWVRADWSASTLAMERDVWVDPRVQRAARPFVSLALDVTEAEGDAERLAERYDVAQVPSLVIIDAHGHPTATLRGLQDAGPILAALRAAAED
jgi:thiol:disulfide interchange protein